MNTKLLRILLMIIATTMASHVDPATDQLILFKEKTKVPIGIMTTASGAPINTNATSTLNKNLLTNEFFMDILTHFDRERILERVVHAKGAGAFGYFEVTNNISDICKAKLFNKDGVITPIVVRFSPVAVDRGGPDTTRETRGFAVKFYTEDGNFDLVTLSTPMFALIDPIDFPSFIKMQRKNPVTNLKDKNMLWDFITLHPRSLNVFLKVFGDPGIPDGYRYMPGFSVHTYQIVNQCGESYFVRFHLIPNQGIRNLSSDEAEKIAGSDPDYSTRDLYEEIAKGNYPSWTLSVQVLTLDDCKNAGFDVFDLTRVLPVDKYPLRPIGRLVLNRNPINYFAQVEQLAYCPNNLVPGILGAPDKIFEARRLSYRDAENYRLGANFFKIGVNCPYRSKTLPYNRDGVAPVGDNYRDIPNYYPNSFNGPVPYREVEEVELIQIYQNQSSNLDQTQEQYNELSSPERDRMIANIVDSLCSTAEFLQQRALCLFATVDKELSERIEAGLQTCNTTKC